MIFLLLLAQLSWAGPSNFGRVVTNGIKAAQTKDQQAMSDAERLQHINSHSGDALDQAVLGNVDANGNPQSPNVPMPVPDPRKSGGDVAGKAANDQTEAAKGKASTEAGGVVQDARYRPPRVVDAVNGGARTLGEYLRMIPGLVEEQKHAAKAAAHFESVAARLAESHNTLAKTYSTHQHEVARSETNLGALAALVPAASSGGGVSGAPAPQRAAATNAFAFEPVRSESKNASSEELVKTDPLEPLSSSLRQFDGKLGHDSSITSASDPDTYAQSKTGVSVDKEKLGRNALLAKLKERAKRGSRGVEGGGEGAEGDYETEAVAGETQAPTDALLSAYEAAQSEKKASFSMLHSETDEYIGNFKREVASIELPPEVLDEESEELFKRVTEAHRRSLKRGDVKLASVSP